MNSKDRFRKGQLVAAVLSGSWRKSDFPPLDISETEVDEITPLLCTSGAAALSWTRIKDTHLANTASAEVLHQAYRLQSLQATIHEAKVEKVFRLLRQSSVDAVLAKGWAAATIYQQTDLRPSGDIDICVRAEQFKLAREILSAPEANDCWVDLHQRFSELDERTLDELFGRSKLVSLGREQVRILSPEDHLALLCIHLLKHSAWRPLWLCDVSVAIETLPLNFDWDVCLGRNKTRARWIICAITLANRLLGTDIRNCPAAAETMELPKWLVENVLKLWSNPVPSNQPPMSHPIPMADFLRRPRGLREGLRQRWPNPIMATISINGEINNFPRLPYQVGNWLARIARLLIRLPEELRER
jgi:hypothetical protein